MARTRTVAGGGRAIEVTPERLAGWFERFARRHGGVERTEAGVDLVVVHAVDGATASVAVPFGPLTSDGTAPIDALVSHVSRSRRVGVALVRLGGHSVGVAQDGAVVVSRSDRRHVQGRTAAGGWSQQRFARRREGQARVALEAAAQDVFEVLVPLVSTLDAVVLGGDGRALEMLRADRRLAPVFAIAEPRVLDVPQPRRTVLDDAAERVRAVEIVVRD